MNRLTNKKLANAIKGNYFIPREDMIAHKEPRLDELYCKLAKYEDLEEELGCSLEFVFKALKILKEEFCIELFENTNGNKAISIYSDTDKYAVVKEISQKEFELLKEVINNGNKNSN